MQRQCLSENIRRNNNICVQIRVGLQGKPPAIRSGSIKTLQVGKYVLVQPEDAWGLDMLKENPDIDLALHPWIGKVTGSPDWLKNEVEVTWFGAASEGKIDEFVHPSVITATFFNRCSKRSNKAPSSVFCLTAK